MLPLPRHGDGVTLNLRELIDRAEHQRLVNRRLQTRKSLRAPGARLSRHKGRGMEFAEVRAYQPGDDIRTIDWRVTARTGKAHTKLFREETERQVLLAVDLGQRMKLGSKLLLQSVQAAHLAALLGWHITASGDRLGCLLVNEHDHRELKPRPRRKAQMALLEGLVELHKQQVDQQIADDYWQQGLTRLERLIRPGSQVLVLTNVLGLAPSSLNVIKQLRRRADVKIFMLTDPLFEQIQRTKSPLAIASQNGKLTGWFDREAKENLSAQYQQQVDQARNELRRNQIPLHEVSAALPLEQQWQTLQL